jgi:hypothetical protein
VLFRSDGVARAQIARFLRQEAWLLGLDDAFYFGASVFLFLAAFVWLARPAPPAKPGPAPAPKLEELEAEELMEQP